MTTPNPDDPYYGVPKTPPRELDSDVFTPSHTRHVNGYNPLQPGSTPQTADIEATAHPPSSASSSTTLPTALTDRADKDAVEANAREMAGSYTFSSEDPDKAYATSRTTAREAVTAARTQPRDTTATINDVSGLSLSEASYRETFSDTTGSSIGAVYAGDNAYTIGGFTQDADFDPSIIAREQDVNRQCKYLGLSGESARSGSGLPYTFDGTAEQLNAVVKSLLDMREQIISATDGGSSTIKEKLAQATQVLSQALEYYASGAGIQEFAQVLETVAQPANAAVMGINTAGLGYVQEYKLAAPVIKELHEAGKNPAGIPGIQPNDVVDELVVAALEAGVNAGGLADSVLSDAVPVAEMSANVTVDAVKASAEISNPDSKGAETKSKDEPDSDGAAGTTKTSAGAATASTSGGATGPIMTPRVIQASSGGGGGYVAASPGQLPTRRVGANRGRGGAEQAGQAGGSIEPNGSGVSIPAEGTFTSGFGPRWGSAHNGIDIANEIGTPIYAVMDGTVINSGPASGFGNWIRIQHEDGSISVYGHMRADMLYVREGEQVKSGQNIAGIGSEGQSTGPHLHFEIHPAGSGAIDPVPWFAEYGISL